MDILHCLMEITAMMNRLSTDQHRNHLSLMWISQNWFDRDKWSDFSCHDDGVLTWHLLCNVDDMDTENSSLPFEEDRRIRLRRLTTIHDSNRAKYVVLPVYSSAMAVAFAFTTCLPATALPLTPPVNSPHKLSSRSCSSASATTLLNSRRRCHYLPYIVYKHHGRPSRRWWC